MEQSIFADWLDSALHLFDASILNFYHDLAEWGSAFLTPFMKFISLLGEDGILLVILSLCLMLFAKTRKHGICMFGALCFGVLFTNLILKNTVCRMRPFEAYSLFEEFWTFVGAEHAGGHSFPSGHTTAATAAMMALVFTYGKKALTFAVPFIVLMGASRNYLMVHYPTDVIAGMIAGTVAALCAYGVTYLLFQYFHKHENMKLSRFVLHFDIKNMFAKRKKS